MRQKQPVSDVECICAVLAAGASGRHRQAAIHTHLLVVLDACAAVFWVVPLRCAMCGRRQSSSAGSANTSTGLLGWALQPVRLSPCPCLWLFVLAHCRTWRIANVSRKKVLPEGRLLLLPLPVAMAAAAAAKRASAGAPVVSGVRRWRALWWRQEVCVGRRCSMIWVGSRGVAVGVVVVVRMEGSGRRFEDVFAPVTRSGSRRHFGATALYFSTLKPPTSPTAHPTFHSHNGAPAALLLRPPRVVAQAAVCLCTQSLAAAAPLSAATRPLQQCSSSQRRQ